MTAEVNAAHEAIGPSVFPIGGGELGALIRAHDWSGTELGPPDQWPQSLKTVTAMLLLSPVPMVLLWGHQGIMLYNDAYSVFAAARHPQLLGSEVRKGWPEVADFNDNVMKVCLAGGTLAYKDQELTLHRNGRPEQVWMNLDYSPVLGETGHPAGVVAFVVETTERVRAERRLLAEKDRLTRLFEQAPGIMAMLGGPEHRYEMANPAYANLVGNRNLLGLTVREALPEIARQGFVELLDQVYQTGEAYVGNSVAMTIQHTPGETEEMFILDFVFQPVIQTDGTVSGIFMQGHDVTQRALAERRIRFLDALGKAIAPSTDADTILATTTRALGEHFGVSVCAYADMDPDENGFTIRGNWAAPGSRSIIGRYRLADFGQLALTNLQAGRPLVLNDNRQLPAHEAATFLALDLAATVCMPLTKEGKLTALMAIHANTPRVWKVEELALLTEVTERSWAHIERVRSEATVRLAEQRFRQELERQVAERTAALAQSEAQIRTVAASSHLYQWLLSTEGAILYANPTSLAGIGNQRETVVGMAFSDAPWFAATPGMHSTVMDCVATAARGGSESLSMRLQLPSGVRSFDFSIRPVLDEDGRVVGIVPEAVDSTARVEAEQALQQAQKMEALGNLTGGIAHDFNNLLTAVMGNLELLRKRVPADSPLLRLIDNARIGAERGASLTRRMLAFARKQDLLAERIQPGKLIEEMTELLERSLDPTVIIETRVQANLPDIEADPSQLQTALLNLGLNARDAIGGHGRIVISAQSASIDSEHGLAAGTYLCLSVADEGEGMNEATLQRAIEPFYTTKGVGKGTGLGLSIVHGFAEQSGGKLLLRSEVGTGTTAQIWLPAAVGDGPAAIATQATEQGAGQRPGLNILAVDDDVLVLFNTAEMLRDEGHQVTTVHSAAQALDHLRETRFDLLITDHAMPKMTGAQLALEVQSLQPSLPVLLVSGYAEFPAGTAAQQLPLLAKPFSQAALLQAVATVTRRDALI
ncbi:histidine kinase [Stutzerimonas stutzeri]|uniref:histidine kinase n=1 Tax=Stutzerimonas stutzeri TaxID=316 RepID=W8QYK5_STUST|nr:PAS domain-containing protein [Stutzerimonas stutzeri]AHL75384.1 histidine kinase [Stutzerimonas stutzeri]MCQ4328060.1 PAS domain-containing protein [Stutzerimonas stutzeri]